MVFSWTQDHIEVRYDVTIPEAIETFPSFCPGGGWESGRDKWAFPTQDHVQLGSFLYPGGSTQPIYPSDGSWATPAEGWIALWDDQVDEVYGFTFSGGYKAKIWNGAAADPHVLFPVGTSRITFHIIRPKPVLPYEAIGAQATGPYLALTNQVDKLFTSADKELTYTLTYRNTGNASAHNVILEAITSPFTEVVQGSISRAGMYDPATRCIRWTQDSVGIGASEDTVTFRAKVLSSVPNEQKIECNAKIWASEEPIATTARSITTVANPIITSVTPDKGGNTGSVTVTINGIHLDPNATVLLKKTDEANIIASNVSGIPEGTKLTTTFDLYGKTAGTYDLALNNPDSSGISLQKGFTIESGGETELWVEIVGRNQIRSGREQTYIIRCGNNGNIDIYDLLLILKMPQHSGCGLQFAYNIPEWIPRGTIYEDSSEIPIWILKLPSKSAVDIPITMNLQESFFLPHQQIRFTGYLIKASESEYSKSGQISKIRSSQIFQAVIESIFAILPNVSSNFEIKARVSIPIARELIEQRTEEFVRKTGEEHMWIVILPPIKGIIIGGIIGAVAAPFLGVDPWTGAGVGAGIGGIIEGGISMFLATIHRLKDAADLISQTNIEVVLPWDPNEKVTSTGYDLDKTTNKQQHFIARNNSLPYVVYFENKDIATAAAQEVLITDSLESNLDWITFSQGTIQVGEKNVTVPVGMKNYSTSIDLRPQLATIVDVVCEFSEGNGVATWLLRGRDPYTGSLADILPPNKPDVDPRGQGYISYFVKPKQNAKSGTLITNKATVDFEVGIPPAPMETPMVFNTIDADTPLSHVLPITVVQAVDSFMVQWVGNDTSTGISNYSIYLSIDGDKFLSWIQNTRDTSAIYKPLPGTHTYSFYSIAYDNVGNAETPPDSFDTRVTVTALTSVPKDKDMPKVFSLAQNYPNPFNPETKIQYSIPVTAHVTLKIYSILGQEIRTVIDELQDPGVKTVIWNSKNNIGHSVASGIYFYRLQAGSFTATKKLVLLR
jgi:uncharacterized repeat protein (TIGR01451 family)